MNKTKEKIIFFPVFILILGFAYSSNSEAQWILDTPETPLRETIVDNLSIQKKSPQTLRAFWWNINEASFSKKISKLNSNRKDSALEKNLVSVVDKLDVDFFILGEFSVGSLSNSLFHKLTEKYKNFYFLPLNPYITNQGQIVFTNWFCISNSSLLDWIPATVEKKNTIEYMSQFSNLANLRYSMDYHYRNFDHLNCVHNSEKRISFIPVHLNNPWPYVRARNNVVKTSWEILFGLENPNATQTNNFLTHLRELKNKYLEENSDRLFISIGDFNIPDNVKGVEPFSFEKIKKVLRYPQTLGSLNFTYPSPTEQLYANIPKVKIDHAFISKMVNSKATLGFQQVLNLKGSDHLPILLDVLESKDPQD